MSQDSTATTTIDGVTYEMRMLDPWVANEILHALWKVVGPSLGEMIAAATAGGINKEAIAQIREDSSSLLDRKMDSAMVGSAISGLFTRMDAKQTRVIIEALADKATTDGKHLPAVFTAVFSGKIGNMYAFASWGLGVQFANFFGSIRNAIEWSVQRAAILAEKIGESSSRAA